MGKSQREKGKRGEREIAHILQGYGYTEARRSQQYAGINSDADVVGLPGIHIEAKRVQALNLDKAMEQAERDAKEDEMPTVWHRKDRQPWRVTLSLENFMKLYQAWEKSQNK